MIPEYRKNLPKKFTAKLEILFPLLFSGHDLVGKNHRALADALQLRLVVMLFEELCKPPNQRDLSLLHKTTRDWLLPANNKKTLLQTQSTNHKSTSGTGSAAEETVKNKQKQRFTRLGLDQYNT